MSLSDLFSRLRKTDPAAGEAAPPAAQSHASRALPRFVAALSGRDAPVLLDLGPVVGANVSFFGEELGCKIFVEDLSKDVDRHVQEDRLPDLPAFLERRFPQEDEAFDGILCWDIFDFLDRASGQALAAQLVRLLKKDGVILAFFNHTQVQGSSPAVYTRHLVIDQRTLEYRPYPAARGKQRPFQNRDIQRMFEPLVITDQFLLKTNMREIVLRKGTGRP